MKRLPDKLFLFLIGLLFIIESASYAKPVAISIVTFSLSCLLFYSDDIRLHITSYVLFMILCFAVPEFLYFLPLLLYDAFMKKQYFITLSLLSVFLHMTLFTGFYFSFYLFSCALSIYLTYRTAKLESAEHKLISLRDNSTELQNVLRKKNKDLMEKQDYEIHLATLRERNRIAREIHDNVGHMLSRSILQMGALTTIYKENPLNEQLRSINETLNSAMTSIRESVHDLHDDSIDLEQSLREILKSSDTRFETRLDYTVSKDVSRNVKYCMISILKEAVSNTVKHSNADKITVIVREHPAFYQMTIEDNGKDIPTMKETNIKVTGIGLSNMRDRVEALDGTFRIHTEKGFHIFLSIPKKEEA